MSCHNTGSCSPSASYYISTTFPISNFLFTRFKLGDYLQLCGHVLVEWHKRLLFIYFPIVAHMQVCSTLPFIFSRSSFGHSVFLALSCIMHYLLHIRRILPQSTLLRLQLNPLIECLEFIILFHCNHNDIYICPQQQAVHTLIRNV